MPDTNTSAIYKIDGFRLIAASAQRAFADASGNQIDTTYLKKADFQTNSAKWDEAADEVTSNSANWNDSYTVLTETSSTWDDVTGKLDKAESANYYPMTGNPSSFLTKDVADGYYVTTATYQTDSATFLVASSITGKQDISAMTSYYTTAQTSGAQEIADALNNKQDSGYYITSADASLNDKMLVLHNNTWMEMPEMGGFATATSAAGGVPDVQNPSTKLIYLVKDSSVTGDDKYNEWIYTSSESTTAWEKIGDTSMDLSQYVTTASTASWDVTPYSGENGIYVTGHKIGLSSDYKTEIEAVSGKLAKSDFDTWSAGKDFTEYTPGANIDITNHVVSGKDWTNDITATASQASANAVTTIDSNFASNTAGQITAYGTSAIAQPDVSDFVTSSDLETALGDYQTTADMSAYLTTATYNTDSASWQSVYDTVNSNSGNWSAAYTVINVPNLEVVPDLTNP